MMRREELRAAVAAVDPVLVAMVAAESAVVWLVVSLLLDPNASSDRSLPPPALFTVMAIAALAPRVLDALDFWDRGFALAMTVLIVATTLLLIKTAAFPDVPWLDGDWLRRSGRGLTLDPNGAEVPVWALVGISVYAWGRGRRRAEPTLDAAYAQLRIGSLAMLLAVLAHGVAGDQISNRAVGQAVLIFFAASLGAIALARLGLGTETGQGRATVGRGAWLAGAAAPIGVVLLLGVIAAGAANRDLLDAILVALAPLVWALTVLLRVLILIVAVIAFILVSPILFLLSGRHFQPREFSPDQIMRDANNVLSQSSDKVADVPAPIRYLVVAVVLLTLISLLAQFVLRRRRQLLGQPDEERESVFDARDLLDSLLNRMRRTADLLRPEGDHLAGLRHDARWAHTLAIREIYASMLRRASERGAPRPQAQTADEYQRSLPGELPAAGAAGLEIARLTGIYDRVRYGAEPATAGDEAAARAAWTPVERALRDG